MANTIEVKVPDIGMDSVPVIEVMVAVGDSVEKEQGLVTLESDKATMEVPATAAGTIKEVKVKEGDDVSEGTVIVVLETDGADSGEKSGNAENKPPSPVGRGNEGEGTPEAKTSGKAEPSPPAPLPEGEGSKAKAPKGAGDSGRKADIECQVVVLGSGPGGYSAAFRAADLGLDTVLIERYDSLGGVCLNVGCIPSKALLHAAAVIDEAESMSAHGVSFGKPKLDLDKLRSFKEKVVGQLTGGLDGMAKKRKVKTVTGTGIFVSPHEMEVEGKDGKKLVRFEKAIIAAGSQALKLPGFPWEDPRIMDSTVALELAEVPKKLLIVGCGIIGLEMATVYAALGSEITVVELADQLMPGADADLVKPLAKRLGQRVKGIHLKTKVVEAKAQKAGIKVEFEGESIPETKIFDRVLVAVGRSANGNKIGADQAGVAVSERGLIDVDSQMRTNVEHIFAIGDIVGQPMLAHKATHEGHVAAEVCAGEKAHFDARVIPSVAFTNPEVAWVGVTERQAKADGLAIEVSKFPWAASGRAIGIDRTEGFTKLIFNKETRRIVGAGIVGVNAGDLISELALAIEMDCEATDIALTIPPHPTLGESVGLAAEVAEGTITDLYAPKKR
ncbi:MAG TPA: dihydrolipoyl dehydrogenase [Oleiagrimonas sp.]|nr:dihydrolipoyl dehydrogenase [Oleiagrimonas sp.]